MKAHPAKTYTPAMERLRAKLVHDRARAESNDPGPVKTRFDGLTFAVAAEICNPDERVNGKQN